MGVRFRKSVKICPGVKLNLNKNSSSISVGTRGAHYTVNSKGKKTVSAGIPGTGLSYVDSTSGKKSKNTSSHNSSPNNNPNGKKWYQKTGWIIALLILFFPVGLFLMWKYTDWNKYIKIGISALFGILMIYTILFSPKLKSVELSADTSTVYDINAHIPLDLKVEPNDFKLSVTDFQVSDGYVIEEKDGFVFITDKVGAHTISVKHNDIESNTISIETEDKKAIEEAKIKAEQEAEKQAQKEAWKAEQEAKKAENEAETYDPTVYVSESGTKYHSNPDCGRLTRETAIEMKESEAIAQGYQPCDKCKH